MTPTDHVSDLWSVRDWLRGLPDLDMADIAADGGVTVAMVVQQEAREMAARLDRILALAPPPAGDGNPQTTWRCFHCDFATSDRGEAELHFGSRPIYDPMCRMTDAGQRREYITLDASYSRVCDELRALKTAAAPSLPAGSADPVVIATTRPPNDWLYEQAQILSSAKDEDSIGALAWNLSVAFTRWLDIHPAHHLPAGSGPSDRQGSGANTSEDGPVRDEPPSSSPTTAGSAEGVRGPTLVAHSFDQVTCQRKRCRWPECVCPALAAARQGATIRLEYGSVEAAERAFEGLHPAAEGVKLDREQVLEAALVALNAALDAYWNVGPGRVGSGGTIKAIEAAQQQSKAALASPAPTQTGEA